VESDGYGSETGGGRVMKGANKSGKGKTGGQAEDPTLDNLKNRLERGPPGGSERFTRRESECK